MTLQMTQARMGNVEDAAFLSRMDYEASLPPFERSFWEELLAPTGTDALDFLETMFRERASLWGNVEDFLIIEIDNKPVACCAVFRPMAEPPSGGQLNTEKLGKIANRLGWSTEARQTFEEAYRAVWDGDLSFLTPQADAIIETVAVDPSYRGQGLGEALMKEAFKRGREIAANTIGIMVIHGNHAAQALYEKHFKPYVSFHGAYFNHEFPGLTKYRAELA